MFRLACFVFLWWVAALAGMARHHHPAPEPGEATLRVGGVQFAIPGNWLPQPPATAARAGQWNVPPTADPAGEPVQVVVFFFGPGVGGTPTQSVESWAATITTPDGRPRTAAPRQRNVAGHGVTEMLLGGTYAQPGPEPGLPPVARPYHALWGAVVENAGGTIYWRATGPAAQVAALAPVLDKVLDSIMPVTAPPPPSP